MSGLFPYLDMIVGAEAEGFAELRWRLRSGAMGREFVGVRDRRRLATLIEARGRASDLYVGVAPRVRHEGGRDAVERVHVLWADCDEPEAVTALDAFSPPPSMVIGSGTGRHAYWALWPPVGPAEAEAANRRIAHALGADARATDAARILRPPGTFNHKGVEPRPVTVEQLAAKVYSVAQVVGRLAEPEPERPPRRAVRLPVATDDPLLAVPPAVYVEALTGREVGRDGKLRCPFHADRTPSLHVYDEPERGWACFGCGKGGTVIDFAARLWAVEPRGRGYHELRQRLERELALALRSAAA